MGVIRYKSTGDMLIMEKVDFEPPDLEEQLRLRGGELKPKSVEQEEWSSCKHLENEYYYFEDPITKKGSQVESKSGLNFLSLNAALLEPAAVEQKQAASRWSESSGKSGAAEQTKKWRTNKEDYYDISRRRQQAKRMRTNGARRKVASLSLSSPMLTQELQELRGLQSQVDGNRIKAEQEAEAAATSEPDQNRADVQEEIFSDALASFSVDCETKQANEGSLSDCVRVDVERLEQFHEHHLTQQERLAKESKAHFELRAKHSSQNWPTTTSNNDNGLPSQHCGSNGRGVAGLQIHANQNNSNSYSATISSPSQQLAGENHFAPTQQPGQQLPASNSDSSRQTDTSSNIGKSAAANEIIVSSQQQPNKLLVDFNNAANRLMGSCNAWRLPAPPKHSGFYKVAQQQQQRQQFAPPQHQLHVSGPDLVTVDREQAQERRVARPGRSPVSLQRQTNARLARHRLKIQQQRQDQLNQLALRERRPANLYQHRPKHTTTSSRTNQATGRNQATLGETSYESLYRINGLLDRLNTQVNESNQQTVIDLGQQTTLAHQQQATNYNNRLASENLQSLISNEPIEICDNQLACGSGSIVNNQQSRQTGTQPHQRSSNASVIALKSFTMTRGNIGANNCLRGKQSQARDLHEIESEDTKTICSSDSIISLNRPFCKICHLGSTKNGDKLISPCRCSGTMQYIHCGCLLKWLEISNRNNEKPISCELCAYEYTWHKKFNYNNMKLPKLSLKDAFLHLIFVISLVVMIISAIAPMLSTHKLNNPSQTPPMPTNEPTNHRMSNRELHHFHHNGPFSGPAAHQLTTEYDHGQLSGNVNNANNNNMNADIKTQQLQQQVQEQYGKS